jgi:hypothetical protein
LRSLRVLVQHGVEHRDRVVVLGALEQRDGIADLLVELVPRAAASAPLLVGLLVERHARLARQPRERALHQHVELGRDLAVLGLLVTRVAMRMVAATQLQVGVANRRVVRAARQVEHAVVVELLAPKQLGMQRLEHALAAFRRNRRPRTLNHG